MCVIFLIATSQCVHCCSLGLAFFVGGGRKSERKNQGEVKIERRIKKEQGVRIGIKGGRKGGHPCWMISV